MASEVVENKMKAKTFDLEGKIIVVTVRAKPNANGLVLLEYNGKKLVRHVDRLEPIDDECRRLLER